MRIRSFPAKSSFPALTSSTDKTVIYYAADIDKRFFIGGSTLAYIEFPVANPTPLNPVIGA
jgi:hypothetical protein